MTLLAIGMVVSGASAMLTFWAYFGNHGLGLLASFGIPVASGKVVHRAEAAKEHVLPRPYVLKPVAEGSSVGVHIVREDHARLIAQDPS